MPKQTFFNLPEEKRRVIENAALNEFAEYGYTKSNLNRIVSSSGIAKGSFYQYFEDKKDLYFHMIDRVAKTKIETLAPVLDHYREHSFCDNLEALFRTGLAFADSDARLYRVGEDFTRNLPEVVAEFIEKYRPMTDNIYVSLLTHATEKGELREGLNIPLTAAFIAGLVNQTTLPLIDGSMEKAKRDAVLREMLIFIEHAVLK